MPKIILLKGLPASGKSTFAKEQIAKDPNTKRVNKDDLRAMLDNSRWSKSNESFVLKVRDFIISEALRNGNNVIVDDTNLHEKHLTRMKELAKPTNSTVEVNDSFLQVPFEKCIARDLKRPNSVGEKVIRDMYKQAFPFEPIIQNYNLPNAIILDIDGTLAIMGNRSPYDWGKVDLDTKNYEVFNLYRLYKNDGYKIIICSGRDEICREKTEKWLADNWIEYDKLYMRPQGSTEKDSVIKERFLNEIVKDYYVQLVVDDRQQVVDMWRSKGLTCFQVNEGNF
jgi:predicted kinase